MASTATPSIATTLAAGFDNARAAVHARSTHAYRFSNSPAAAVTTEDVLLTTNPPLPSSAAVGAVDLHPMNASDAVFSGAAAAAAAAGFDSGAAGGADGLGGGGDDADGTGRTSYVHVAMEAPRTYRLKTTILGLSAVEPAHRSAIHALFLRAATVKCDSDDLADRTYDRPSELRVEYSPVCYRLVLVGWRTAIALDHLVAIRQADPNIIAVEVGECAFQSNPVFKGLAVIITYPNPSTAAIARAEEAEAASSSFNRLANGGGDDGTSKGKRRFFGLF
jgi:hypothetical protein